MFPNETNAAAEEGTACHEAVERTLNGELIRPGFTAENGVSLGVEQLAHVTDAVDWVLDQDFDRIMLEERVEVGQALGLNDPSIMWGTSDIIAIKGSAAYIIDHKFGRVEVAVRKPALPGEEVGQLNSQAMCYLVGALHSLAERFPGHDFDEFVLVIIQPKAGGVKQATVTWPEINQFKTEAREAVYLALSGDAPFNPGEEQCRFCNAAGSCKAQLSGEFSDLDDLDESVSPDRLSDNDLVAWLDKADYVASLIKSMKMVALQRMAAGVKLPGWAREQGTGRAKWRDVDEVVQAIEAAGLDMDDYAPRSPVTQGALKASTALGAKVVESLIVRPVGEVKLVRESDATDPLEPEFEVLD
jgi:hypothetical protein